MGRRGYGMTNHNHYSRHHYSTNLHPARNGLRTATRAAIVTVAFLLPAVWVLDAIGAL